MYVCITLGPFFIPYMWYYRTYVQKKMPIDPQKITRVKGLLVRVGSRTRDQYTRYILNTCKHAILPGRVQTVLQYNRSKR